jgi:hypothetical protein
VGVFNGLLSPPPGRYDRSVRVMKSHKQFIFSVPMAYLNGCIETDTARQYTLYLSDSEEDLISEQNNSSTVETVHINKSSSLLETPD